MQQNEYQYIVGVDEVGRGPLAGPVLAGAVLLRGLGRLDTVILQDVRDSKQLTPAKRERLYAALIDHPHIIWGIGEVSEKIIDRINIFEAAKLAMETAIQNLEQKLQKGVTIDSVIIDGNISLEIDLPQFSIVKADTKIISCSLASILAKVTRDKIMDKYHTKYPAYGFNSHKGYGSPQHLKALRIHGPCPIHRQSFAPISTYLVH